MRNEKGFTLIELVMVIVLLGILAALAIPRYASLQTEARIAVVNGMAGGLRSSVALARAKYMVVGNMTNTTVDMDGVNVDVVTANGRPDATATGITVALQDTSGFGITYAVGPPITATFRPTNGGGATCQVVYDETNATVTVTTTGC